MTDIELFRAFLEQAGLDGQECPDPHPGGGDAPGTTFTIDWASDRLRWDGYSGFAFSASFGSDGNLVAFGAFE